jgi:predicted RNA-binding Zn-ribbon protein involved in translation (DUF1610 family)
MGEVVTLQRTVCTCGWKMPANLTVVGHGIDEVQELAVWFGCPECERMIRSRPETIIEDRGRDG